MPVIEGTLALAAFAFGSLTWRVLCRRRGGLSASALFLASLIGIVHVGFMVTSITRGAVPSDALVASSTGVLTFAVGSLLSLVAWPTTTPPHRGGNSPLGLNARRLLSIATFVAAACLLYYVLLGFMPLLSSLEQLASGQLAMGEGNVLRTSRDRHINPDGGVPLAGLFDAVRYFAAPAAIALCVYRARQSAKRRAIFYSTALLLSILLAGTLQRWPLIYAFIVCLPVFIGLPRPSQSVVPPERLRRRLIRITLLFVIGLILLTIVLGRAETRVGSEGPAGVQGALQDLTTRVFIDQVSVSIESYNQDLDLQIGYTYYRNLLALQPGGPPSYPAEFYAEVTGDEAGYTAPPDFTTELFINGSYHFVAIGMIVWSLLLGAYDSRHRARVLPSGRPLDPRIVARLIGNIALGFTSVSGPVFALGGLLVAVALSSQHSGLYLRRGRRKRARTLSADLRDSKSWEVLG